MTVFYLFKILIATLRLSQLLEGIMLKGLRSRRWLPGKKKSLESQLQRGTVNQLPPAGSLPDGRTGQSWAGPKLGAWAIFCCLSQGQQQRRWIRGYAVGLQPASHMACWLASEGAVQPTAPQCQLQQQIIKPLKRLLLQPNLQK